MKKVLVIGATGRAGSQVVRFLGEEDVEMTLVSRSIGEGHFPGVAARRVPLDATDQNGLEPVVEGQDVIVVVSNGDALAQAEALLGALTARGAAPERIIWLTGMGIHGEVPGIQGLQYKVLAVAMKSYVKAADAIAASDHPSILLRAPLIVEEDATGYRLIHEGERLPSQRISYAAIGRFVADVVAGRLDLSEKESLGIVE